jgi:LemA protein
MGLIIAIAALLVMVVWAIQIYNGLVGYRNQVDAAWSDIDVQLQRRHDLVPRLVEAVKVYAGYEKSTLEAVTALRARSVETTHVADRAKIEQKIETGMHRLIALAEDYPDLKASENFLTLQDELTEVENELQYSRRFYNGSVRLLNTRIASFPDILVARACDFAQAEFFDAGQEAESPVRVDLD